MQSSYLASITDRFQYYKSLGEKAMAQLSEEEIFRKIDPYSNSIAVIVKHLWGNMRSRWTDFLSSDGEKEWRNRETEFDNDLSGINELTSKWEEGWEILFHAIRQLSEDQLESIVKIRNEDHTVIEAINRQLAHYSYHIGQMVYVARMIKGENWQSLSIPKGGSENFNKKMFT